MPPGVTTLLAIRTAVRQRADQVNSQFCTDAEVNSYVNASYQELYDLLATHFGDDYFVSPTPLAVTTDGVNDHFALPADFYKCLGVDLSTGTGQWTNLARFNFADRNKFTRFNQTAAPARTNLSYRLAGNNLWLMPLPASGLSLRVFYVPRLTILAADTDTVDGVSGWEEFIITDAAIKCMQKEESDVSVLMAQKQALGARIEAAAANRDAGAPMTTVDSQGANGEGLWPGSGVGFNGGW